MKFSVLPRAARGLRRLGAVLCVAFAAGVPAAPAVCPPPVKVPTAGELQALRRDAADRGFLWRIRRDGRVSALYGTLHVGKVEWTVPGPRVAQALQDSDVIALEIDPLDEDMQRRIAAALAPNPAQRLPAATRARLRERQRAACVDADAMAPLAPELQATMLVLLEGRRDGLDASFGIDAALAGLARAAGKPVVSLETPEAQLAALTGDARRGLRLVEETLTQLEQGRAAPLLRRTAEVWAGGRYDELSGYESWCDCVKNDGDRAFLKRLLDDRNAAMAERIEALHASGRRVFAAVGSLHLTGTAGLPALLAARGFTVERVEFGR